MRKEDETAFLIRLAEVRPNQTMSGPTADEIGLGMGIPVKRLYFIYEKWCRQGIYECGVSFRMGWLTAKGIGAAAECALTTIHEPNLALGQCRIESHPHAEQR